MEISKDISEAPDKSFQFIDLCILLGCDYLEPIKGVGPKSALKLVRDFGDLGKIVEHLRDRYSIALRIYKFEGQGTLQNGFQG